MYTIKGTYGVLFVVVTPPDDRLILSKMSIFVIDINLNVGYSRSSM